jgi:hypothetical protein
MFVDGICGNGHPLLCVMSDGKLRGATVRGSLRTTCPQCGADIVVRLESAVLPVSRPSQSLVRSGTGED